MPSTSPGRSWCWRPPRRGRSASVEVDGAVRCRAPCDVELEPLEARRLRVLAPGYSPLVRELTPEPGQVGELRFELTESPAAVEARSARRWALAIAGLSAVLAGGGAIVLSSGLDTADRADDAYGRYTAAESSAAARSAWEDTEALDRRSRTEMMVGFGLLGVAVVAALAAGWRWTSDDAESAAP